MSITMWSSIPTGCKHKSRLRELQILTFLYRTDFCRIRQGPLRQRIFWWRNIWNYGIIDVNFVGCISWLINLAQNTTQMLSSVGIAQFFEPSCKKNLTPQLDGTPQLDADFHVDQVSFQTLDSYAF